MATAPLDVLIRENPAAFNPMHTESMIEDNHLYDRHLRRKEWVARQRDLRLKLHLKNSTQLPFSTRNMRIAGLNSVYAGESFPEDYHAVSATDAERLNAAYRARIKGHKIDTHELARMTFKDVVEYKI